MQLVETQKLLRKAIQDAKASGKTIGFVPTMGALHQGHLSLVREAKKESDFVVTSIFVNPTQFNQAADLKKYPRTLEADLAMLEAEACDLVFVPTEDEMYPQEEVNYLDIDLGVLDKVMEGQHRPGHFDGVALVVHKLFEMVNADKAFFGEKDFQQVAVIRAMVAQTNNPTEVIACPIVREADGLAMSSRNVRLSPAHRNAAPAIAKSLRQAKEMAGSNSVEQVLQTVRRNISTEKLFELEYFEIVDKNTLLPASNWDTANGCVACIALWAGEVRLIDNIQFS